MPIPVYFTQRGSFDIPDSVSDATVFYQVS